MLGTGKTIGAVAEILEDLPSRHEIPIVLDPVLQSSSGHPLLDQEGLRELPRLLKLVSWVTPNTVELASITAQQIAGTGDIASAAAALQQTYPNLNVVVTGGHLNAPDDFLRATDGKETWFRGEWVESRSIHGTGCAFSSALLSRLVLGDSPQTAVAEAKAYVTEAIRSAPVGIGQGHGPLNHLWPRVYRRPVLPRV
jgi:hydroxymethylpyrimidine/phosphomethylpyrimidine kinase